MWAKLKDRFSARKDKNLKKLHLYFICFNLLILSFFSCNKKDVNNPYSSERNQLKKSIEATDVIEAEKSKELEKSLSKNQKSEDLKIDYDLTNMSSTMIYAEVFNMLIEPEKYENKRVKMKGFFTIYNEGSKDEVYSVIVPDSTACCQQGIEFFYDFKDNKPVANSEITVTGIFNVHMLSDGISYNYIKAEKIQ